MKKSFLLISMLIVSFGLGYAFNILTSKKEQSKSGRVTGIGGVFFKCKDPKNIKLWYSTNLGLQTDQYGTTFEWRLATDSTKKGFTQWAAFNEKTSYFNPSIKDFMINYRVDDLVKLVGKLKTAGVTITDTIESFDYGKFVHIMDPEGNKIELWEPIDNEYDKIAGNRTK